MAGSLWAADPIIGTWKLNREKSTIPEGRGVLNSPPKEIIDVYREIGDGLIEFTSGRIFMDGTSDFAVWSWSRDGKWLIGCARQGGGEYSGIVTYSLESQRYDWVTDFGRSPEWLSDSRRILFDHNGTIFLADTQSKQVREILKVGPVSLDSTIGHFGISGDDRLIYFIRDVSEADIWLMEME